MSLLNRENNKKVKRDHFHHHHRIERIEKKRKMGLRDIEATLPPGFRFYPSDEELVCHYLYKKIANEEALKGTLVEIDLHTCEPWQLPEVAKLNTSEWYFFSFRDRKYATGFRTNRATISGYWKATGKDRVILDPNTREIVGMRKTLVFYRNRAPNGIKTGWIMHEFRLESPHMPPKEDWVLCRVFHKSKGEQNNNNNNNDINNYQQQMIMINQQQHMIDQTSASTSSPPLITSSSPHAPISTSDHHHQQQQKQQQQPGAYQQANTSSLFIPTNTNNNNNDQKNNSNNDNGLNHIMNNHHNHQQQVGLVHYREGIISSSLFSYSDLINSGGAKNDDDFGFLWDMDLEEDTCHLKLGDSSSIIPHHHDHNQIDGVRFEDDGGTVFF